MHRTAAVYPTSHCSWSPPARLPKKDTVRPDAPLVSTHPPLPVVVRINPNAAIPLHPRYEAVNLFPYALKLIRSCKENQMRSTADSIPLRPERSLPPLS